MVISIFSSRLVDVNRDYREPESYHYPYQWQMVSRRKSLSHLLHYYSFYICFSANFSISAPSPFHGLKFHILLTGTQGGDPAPSNRLSSGWEHGCRLSPSLRHFLTARRKSQRDLVNLPLEKAGEWFLYEGLRFFTNFYCNKF